jgi:DNA-binding NarL/FixJ family response regulator
LRQVRILIADDNQLVRCGIAKILGHETDLVVCGEATDASEALSKASELRPDLILMDVSMPGSNGLDTARVLHQQIPDVKIVFVSQHDAAQLLALSLEAGAQGFVDKARIVTDLLPLISSIFRDSTS